MRHERYKKKQFSYRIVTGDENWNTYNNTKSKKIICEAQLTSEINNIAKYA